MIESVTTAEGALGISLPALRESAEHTVERIQVARQAIEEFVVGDLTGDADRTHEPLIAAFGSMARGEMALGSDFDFLVILNALETDPDHILRYRKAALHALTSLSLPAPGSTGLFGVAISGADLVNTIGLDGDTNLHQSRRMLLLEEGLPLNNDDGFEHLVRAIVSRYLHEGRPALPRFLLNDVMRYWRTIAVDYQAKRWAEMEGRKWGLRFVKLMSTRKMTYASTLISLMWPALNEVDADVEILTRQFRQTPVGRFAQLADLGPADVAAKVGEILLLHDWFVGRLADDDFRQEVGPVMQPRAADVCDTMAEAVKVGDRLDDLLSELFFDIDPIARLSRRYLLF